MRRAAPLISPALGLLALLSSTACGQGPQGAFLGLAFERSGARDYEATVASVVILDADTAPAWLGAERAGLSATAAPAIEAPLDVCRVESNLGADVSTLHLLDPGPSTLEGPSNSQSLEATPPDFGDGTGYTLRLEGGEIPYQPGGGYQLRADGAEAPPISVDFTAPSEFQVETLGFATPGPGTVVFASNSDLDLVWAPESKDKDEDMYIVFTSAESRVLCRARDDGAFTIKAKLLQQLPLGAATLSLERSKLVKLNPLVASTGKFKAAGRVGLRYRYVAELQ